MSSRIAEIDSIRDRVIGRCGKEPPHWIMILGSGLGGVRNDLQDAVSVSYKDVGIPEPGVEGHEGSVFVGWLGGQRVAILSGRLHGYEGHEPFDMVLGVRSLIRWDPAVRKKVVVTAAVGSLHSEWRPGTLVAVSDHLNFTGRNPLVGPNVPELGERFVDIARMYDPGLRALAQVCAREQGIELPEGVYAATLGPTYESPAEVRMFGRLGADLVGMSLVHESMAAAHAGQPVLGLCLVTNIACGIEEDLLRHSDVKVEAALHGPRMARLLAAVVRKSAAPSECL